MVLSGLLHGLVVCLFLGLVHFHFRQTERIDFEVFEKPFAKTESKLVSQPKKALNEARKVFGLSKQALRVEGEAVSEKAGNTLAKEPDHIKLNDNDLDLPIPTDEYLVDAMPILTSEVRVPYPKEAKEANIEGPVVMDILIDQTGKVRKVDVMSGPGHGLNEAASEAILKFQFTPAKVKTGAVAARIRYTYRFLLQK